MNNGFSRRMKERIATSPDGSVFTASDFADIADTATIGYKNFHVRYLHPIHAIQLTLAVVVSNLSLTSRDVDGMGVELSQNLRHCFLN